MRMMEEANTEVLEKIIHHDELDDRGDRLRIVPGNAPLTPALAVRQVRGQEDERKGRPRKRWVAFQLTPSQRSTSAPHR
jgi:hypothetical protein